MHDDPTDGAARRYERLLNAHPELLNIPARAERILNENSRFQVKSARLYRLADEMKAMLEPFVVCGPGCSYCCYWMTMIYQHEADAIAAASGRKARKLSYRHPQLALDAARAFKGQPCPFLLADRCSIYQHRPLICRVHNSLNEDPHDCIFPPKAVQQTVEAVDPDFVEMPYHQAVQRWKPSEPWGAIQEFFVPDDAQDSPAGPSL
jgi:hypothetical protein